MPSLIDFSQSVQTVPGTLANPSAAVLSSLQQTYGAIKYTQQSVTRYPYYSYIPYPLAGSSSLSFFGQNQASGTPQTTNLEQAGSTGNYTWLITSIAFDVWFYLPTPANNAPWSYSASTGDASCPYADMVHGLTQGGYAQFTVNNTLWDEVGLPFMYSPPANGRARTEIAAGMAAFTQAGA